MRTKITVVFTLCVIIPIVMTYYIIDSFYDDKFTNIVYELKIGEEKLKIGEEKLKIGEEKLKKFQTFLLQSQQKEIELKAQLFQRNLDARADIVNLLANTPEIQSYAKIAEYSKSGNVILSDSFKENVQKRLSRFVESDPDIDQAKILDMAGMEIIRVNVYRGNVFVESDLKLQDKSNIDGFTELLKLEADELYISNISLNGEHGSIQIPHKPTLRIATTIYDSNNEKLGILIINYIMKDYLEFLSSSPICDVVIFDQNGMIIQHKDEEKTFGLQLGTDYTYYSSHPDFEEHKWKGESPYYDEKYQQTIAWKLTKNFSTERYWHFVCEGIV